MVPGIFTSTAICSQESHYWRKNFENGVYTFKMHCYPTIIKLITQLIVFLEVLSDFFCLFLKVLEEEEGEVKFEWQRGAPREAYVP